MEPEKIRIYIDQNILGYMVEHDVQLEVDDGQIIYSETHFKEIPVDRSNDFCETLDRNGARCIKVHVEKNFKIQDTTTVMGEIPAKVLYEDFYKRYEPSTEAMYDGFMSYLFGSKEREAIFISDKLIGFLEETLNDVEGDLGIQNPDYMPAIRELDLQLEESIPEIGDIESNRKAMGTDKGRLNTTKKSVIQKIFDEIAIKSNVNLKEYLEAQIKNKSKYEQIAGLHMLLNIVGYNPDRQLKDEKKMVASRHDAEHIGHGVFCSAIMSEDRRLVMKARAIYEYLDIGTKVIQVKTTSN